MEQTEILQKINSFSRWHYQFDLRGHLTPIADPTRINRHFQRKAYFFDPLVNYLGGSLEGKRVLDLGCNAGFWSLACIEADAQEIVGIDGRQMHIDQANFVFEVKGIAKDRYRFITGNIFDLDFLRLGHFDLVLCLGLLYHVRHPVLLLEKIAQVNKDVLVIDTSLAVKSGAYLQVQRENIDDPRNSVDMELILLPSKEAVLDIAQLFGYAVVILKPQMRDWTGAMDYKNGIRRAFWCMKETGLANLSVEIENVT